MLAEDRMQDRRGDRGRHFGDTRVRDSGAGRVPCRFVGPDAGLVAGRVWGLAVGIGPGRRGGRFMSISVSVVSLGPTLARSYGGGGNP